MVNIIKAFRQLLIVSLLRAAAPQRLWPRLISDKWWVIRRRPWGHVLRMTMDRRMVPVYGGYMMVTGWYRYCNNGYWSLASLDTNDSCNDHSYNAKNDHCSETQYAGHWLWRICVVAMIESCGNPPENLLTRRIHSVNANQNNDITWVVRAMMFPKLGRVFPREGIVSWLNHGPRLRRLRSLAGLDAAGLGFWAEPPEGTAKKWDFHNLWHPMTKSVKNSAHVKKDSLLTTMVHCFLIKNG